MLNKEVIGSSGGIAITSSVRVQLELSLHFVDMYSYASLYIESDQSPYWILSYVVDGEVTMTTGNDSWLVRAGEIMLHPPSITFSEHSSSAGTHQYMLFEAKTAPYMDLFRLHMVAPVVRLVSPSFFSTTFAILQKTWNNKDADSSLSVLQMSALATQLFCHVIESWQYMGSPPRPSSLLTLQDRFTHVISYMTNHLDQKLSRDDLAALVHLHPGYFGRVFQQIYAISPMEMLRELRWRRAISLLETTELPLTTIATDCGLQDAAYFSRMFRKRYGQPPSSYRQSAKNTRMSTSPPL